MVGLETADDAGVYLLNENIALIQSVDFFTPIVDDPYTFGAIAAVNALSDIYAMGGKPYTAMNILAFPIDIFPAWVLAEVLRGGAEKLSEAGAVLLGGHSVKDDEPKYGLAVTGVAHPSEIWTNAGAKVGDELILTKPLGIGIITSALRKSKDMKGNVIVSDVVPDAVKKRAIEVMMILNEKAALIAREVGINACTDVTGFGLLGHSWEMGKASNVQIEISLKKVPVIEGARELGEEGFIAGGNWANLEYMSANTDFFPEMEMIDKNILADPITSGGLLIAVPKEKAKVLLNRLQERGVQEARIIGRVVEGESRIAVKP